VKLIGKFISIKKIGKNTKNLQSTILEKIPQIASYAILQHTNLEFVLVVRTIIRESGFNFDFFRKKNYLNLFLTNPMLNSFTKNLFKGVGFIIYADTLCLNSFFLLQQKLEVFNIRFLFFFYKGLFINENRYKLLLQLTNLTILFNALILSITYFLFFSFSFLRFIAMLIALYLRNLFFFLLKSFSLFSYKLTSLCI
jgi:hypothetical protein